MENRYLYRAKRIDNGEWIVGSLIIDKHQDIETGEQIEIIGIYPSEYKDFSKRIDPFTICQCTGLKDKSGKLIFENDIVKDNVIYGAVKWDDANARYIIDDRDDGYQDYSEWWHEVGVIGNAFDNPELLEV